METQVSMINKRGRVVWVEGNKVAALRDEGWRVIVNPKETYYPQYDQSGGKVVPEDEIGVKTKVVDNSFFADVLGIIVL